MPKLGPPLRDPPVVVVQNATRLLSAVNHSVDIGPIGQLLDQFVTESLVVTLLVIALCVVRVGYRKNKHPFPKSPEVSRN